MGQPRLYWDHNSTSPPYPEVIEAVRAGLSGPFGNPSSPHGAGRRARRALEEARERVAEGLGCEPLELIWVSGATEGNWLAIEGILGAIDRSGLVTTELEHGSVLAVARALERRGVRVRRLPARSSGEVDLEAVESAESNLDPSDFGLLSVHLANNETGVIQPVEELAGWARRHGLRVHVDAAQGLGRLPLCLRELPCDAATLTCHKAGGPKGIGLVYLRRDTAFRPPVEGAQERGQRPGTENLAGALGFARLVELLAERGEALRRHLTERRDGLWRGMRERVPGACRNGEAGRLLPNTLNVSFPGRDSEPLLVGLDLVGVAASAGSACASGSREPSHVLQAMGFGPERVRSALRFSAGWSNAPGEEEELLERLLAVLERA